jgi:hypothetical protein
MVGDTAENDDIQAILDRLPPKPPRSKLEPYAELIKELRKRGRSYREIAGILTDCCRVSTGTHTVYNFVRMRALDSTEFGCGNCGELDLSRLRVRLREKPGTKAGQVRQVWPDIRNLLAAGNTLKDVWKRLNEIGLQIGYACLSHYVGELRLRDQAAQVQCATRMASQTAAAPYSSARRLTPQPTPTRGRGPDPLANILERESKRPGFNYHEEPDPKKLI